MNVRMGPWSLRVAPRALAVTALLLVIACAAALAAISTGEFFVSVPDILTALFGQGTPVAELIVSKLRAPGWPPGCWWGRPSG